MKVKFDPHTNFIILDFECNEGMYHLHRDVVPAFRQWLLEGNPEGFCPVDDWAWGDGKGGITLYDRDDVDYFQEFTVEEILEALPPT